MAGDFRATIRWSREAEVFTDGLYSRAHLWVFDGLEVPGSSAPSSVRLPYSRADAVDPEEALVAATSSCHMLFALDFARRAGFRVDSYEDAAQGVMSPNDAGKFYLSRITLSPMMVFSGDRRPTDADVAAIHHQAHAECYVANSLRAEIIIDFRYLTV
ncbi:MULTISPECIES: OsmC family protein [unclassified Xanthobacter]|uniref:OsmC family protein n=1 Tax=unclassified Xanthobacter TaxID=2623496 RepID=UPI001F4166BB|nr:MULTISPECIES: OsmC family protein [unclassified Xanthobacter]